MVKIIQYYVGSDQRYLQVCKASKTVNQKYAKIYGYQYSFEHIPEQELINFYGACDREKIIAYKIKLMYDNLMEQDNDVVVFIDADAAISKPTIKIEDLLDDEHDLYLSKGNQMVWQMMLLNSAKNKLNQLFNTGEFTHVYYQNLVGKYNLFKQFEWLSIGCIMMNAGFIIIKNTQLMRELFADCLIIQQLMMDTVYKDRTQDERALSLCLLKQKYFNSFTFMYQQAQGGIYNGYGTKYNEQSTFVLHNYGEATSKEQKIKQIYELLNNKWWKQIQEI